MVGFWVPARQFPSQPSLLVISLPERTARVCLPPRSRLRWHASTSPLAFPCPSLAFTSLPLSLSPRALTGSVSIGRMCQTR